MTVFELNEIKAALEQHPGVAEAFVMFRDDLDGGQLQAYIVPHPHQAFTVQQILRKQQEGAIAAQQLYTLPNDMTITHLNKIETDFVYQEIFAEQSYIQHGITLAENACIFDVGANIGLFTLFISQRYKNTTIYAFEPLPPTFDVLKANCSLYKMNVKLFNCGLSDTAGNATFSYYKHDSVISGHLAHYEEERESIKTFLLNQYQSVAHLDISDKEFEQFLEARLDNEQFCCPLKTISEVIEEQNIAQIDLLKIDVERSELAVLAGIRDTDWPKIQQLVIEVHDIAGRLDRITALLRHWGFTPTIQQDSPLAESILYKIYAIRSPQRPAIATHSWQPSPQWSSVSRLINDVEQFLTARLSSSTLPIRVVALSALPLTPYGEIDLQALSSGLHLELCTSYTLPQTPLEHTIANIWQEVLQVEKVGIHQNFFTLAPHPFLVILVQRKLCVILKAEVPLITLFKYPTVHSLANFLSG